MLICNWCGKECKKKDLDMDEFDIPRYCPECGHSQFTHVHEGYTRAERRKNGFAKAIRKRNMNPEYYKNLHQYSKNKIHCSCPLCACKTKGRLAKRLAGPGKNWSIRDRKRMDMMNKEAQEV